MCNSVLNDLLLAECTPVFLILYLKEINSDQIYMLFLHKIHYAVMKDREL